jgi:lysophospholipase L1-like esterase
MRGRLALPFAVVILIAAGCGGGNDGSGSGGDAGGAAGNTGAAGTSARGGSGGGTAGTSGAAGTSGSTGIGGSTGVGGTSGTTGSAGSNAGSGGAAGMGGSTGRGGSGGTGAGGAGGAGGGAAGAGGRGGGGATGAGGTGGVGGRGGTGGAAGAGGRGGTTGGGGAAGALTNPRVMPLGDSTTASICYRALLWQMLQSAGKTQFNFVGTRNGDPGCNVSGYDRDNEGHGGYIVTDVLKAAGTGVRPGGADANDPFVSDSRDLATWFDGKPADIVLMHFGTNDVWNSKAPATILEAYATILARLRAANPSVRVMVAQITSLQPSGCSDCPTRVQTLNGMIPGWAATNSTSTSPVTVVDQNTGFNPSTDTADGVHANTSGSMKIAAKWFTALSPMIAN